MCLIDVTVFMAFSKDIGKQILILSKDIGKQMLILSKDIGKQILILSKDIGKQILILSKDIGKQMLMNEVDGFPCESTGCARHYISKVVKMACDSHTLISMLGGISRYAIT